jgi:hypothetical protein
MRNQNEQVYKLPVTIMRGGTSKGIYILESDLPENREEWDAILLRLMGSPDSKQIDGLGGSQSVTSKVAIVGKSQRVDADVDYTFAQVSVAIREIAEIFLRVLARLRWKKVWSHRTRTRQPCGSTIPTREKSLQLM